MDSTSYLGVYINFWYTLESVEHDFIAYNYWNFLKFSDFISIIKHHENDYMLLSYWCDLKVISNNFSFWYNENLTLKKHMF